MLLLGGFVLDVVNHLVVLFLNAFDGLLLVTHVVAIGD
jgi:hypothetical protein